MKRLFSLLIITILILQNVTILPVSAADTNLSRMLMVSGNKIVYADQPSEEARLVGVNVPGAIWMADPGKEYVLEATKEAINNWNCNYIRLGVGIDGWFGNFWYVHDGGDYFRQYIDNVINEVGKAGKYVLLDLHQFGSFNDPRYITFWQQAAVRYKNNPTVLFGILNEPVNTTWEVWRNGDGGSISGHQQVVEMIRDLGAKNIIVAGGLSYSGDLTGIIGKSVDASGNPDPKVYALIDQGTGGNAANSGNGIMYDFHAYPGGGVTEDWERKAGGTRRLYPIMVGEFGWQVVDDQPFLGKTYNDPQNPRYHTKWFPELFAWMNNHDTYGNYAGWTAFCFHKSSAPAMLITDTSSPETTYGNPAYTYPPTDFFGVYIKNELARIAHEVITPPDVVLQPPVSIGANSFIQLKRECDIAGGKTLDNWSGNPDAVTYVPGGAEDGVGTAFRLNINYFNTGLGGDTIGDMRNAEYICFRMKSTVGVKLSFIVDFRNETSLTFTTKQLAMPSTNGKWADVYVRLDDFGEPRLKQVVTTYENNNFNPVVQMKLNRSTSGDLYISNISTYEYTNMLQVTKINFMNGGQFCNSGLKQGSTDIILSIQNPSTSRANKIMLCAAMYRKDTNKLVASNVSLINPYGGVISADHKVSVTMPDGGNVENYYIKLYLWGNNRFMEPIIYPVRFDVNGCS